MNKVELLGRTTADVELQKLKDYIEEKGDKNGKRIKRY